MTPGEEVIDVKNSDDIVAARQAGHQLARDLGFSLTDVTMIATAISEIAVAIIVTSVSEKPRSRAS